MQWRITNPKIRTDAQAALGRIYSSMGLDPVADGASTLGVKELAQEIRKTMRDWRKVRARELIAASAAEPPK